MAAAALGLTARDLLRLGIVDGVSTRCRPPASVPTRWRAADELRAALLASLAELSTMTRRNWWNIAGSGSTDSVGPRLPQEADELTLAAVTEGVGR